MNEKKIHMEFGQIGESPLETMRDAAYSQYNEPKPRRINRM